MQDMVKSVYPEAVEVRRAERMKAAATRDFKVVVLSDSVELDQALLQVKLAIYTHSHLYEPCDVSCF